MKVVSGDDLPEIGKRGGLRHTEGLLKLIPVREPSSSSGFSETERVTEAQRLGASAYIKKPFLLEQIGIAVRYELKRARK